MLEQIREQVKALLDEKARLDARAKQARTNRSRDTASIEAGLASVNRDLDGLQERLKELEAIEARDVERERDALRVDSTSTPTPLGPRPYSPGRVRSEPTAYTREAGHSFFEDAFAAHKGRASGPAAERLQRHENEVRAGVHGREFRDVGTSAFSALVVPQFLVDLYAENLFAGRVTANLAANHQLPPEGLTLTLPRGTTAARVEAQTSENFAVQETDYGSTDLVVNVVTYAGQQDVSRQSLERGRGTDEVIFGDLVGDYAAKLDRDVINGPGSGGRHKGIRQSVLAANTVTAKGSGATKITGRQLLTNIHDAISRINGSRFLPADAVVFTPQRWGWLLDQSDSNGRPLVLSATAYGPTNAVGVGAAAGYGLVGTVAGVPAYTDANVPSTVSSSTFGSEDVVIVTRSRDLHLWEENGGVPRQFTFEETLGGNLTVKLVAAAYSAFTAEHHPEGVAVISGSGLTNFGGLF